MSNNTNIKRHFALRISRLVIGVVVVAILTAGIVVLASISMQNNIAYSQYPFGPERYVFGTISSVQNGENAIAEWVLSGHWKSNLLSQIQTNQTTSSSAVFDASFEMVMVNGSGLHRHTITNFNLTKASMPNKNTVEFNGTATASMRNGPVTNIPISIKFMGDKVISMWLDPTKINNHYGNTPIFGTVIKPFSSMGSHPR
jgi:hypothetical protein